MKPHEALARIHSGDLPTQPFLHHNAKTGYRWINRYTFGDGAIVTAHVVRTLLSRRQVQLVIEGDIRRVERCARESLL